MMLDLGVQRCEGLGAEHDHDTVRDCLRYRQFVEQGLAHARAGDVIETVDDQQGAPAGLCEVRTGGAQQVPESQP
jgi:hypothetical protein